MKKTLHHLLSLGLKGLLESHSPPAFAHPAKSQAHENSPLGISMSSHP